MLKELNKCIYKHSSYTDY